MKIATVEAKQGGYVGLLDGMFSWVSYLDFVDGDFVSFGRTGVGGEVCVDSGGSGGCASRGGPAVFLDDSAVRVLAWSGVRKGCLRCVGSTASARGSYRGGVGARREEVDFFGGGGRSSSELSDEGTVLADLYGRFELCLSSDGLWLWPE